MSTPAHDNGAYDKPRFLAESTALRRLGIDTPCCVSCLAEESDTGEMPHQADQSTGLIIDCCCTHVDALNEALKDGTLKRVRPRRGGLLR